MEKVHERFLRYVKYDTGSQEDAEEFPSTKKQLVFLEALAEELRKIGLRDVEMDKYGYVFAALPSNIDAQVPAVGFIAHVDTSPAVTDENVNPVITENYDGEDIIINKTEGLKLSPAEFPQLKNYIGKTIINTDGTTLLGADDKAGVAEIVTAIEYLINHPEIKHGPLRIGFTPDEEVGRGADFFDVKRFNASFAYTIDGGEIGELEYENFNAAGVKVIVKGKSVHTGSAKGIMKNSMLIASEFIGLLPPDETPANTEGYEGFYHLDSIKGNVEETKMSYIIRDFKLDGLEQRKKVMKSVRDTINNKYGKGTVEIIIRDQYFNMIEKIKEHPEVLDIARRALEMAGIKPKIQPIRGGTDGSRLSYMGLPAPNIFTGGHNFHGKYEYIPVESMEKSVEVILNIIKLCMEV